MTQFNIISIDIGLKTTSFCHESYDCESVSKFEGRQYETTGEATPEFKDWVNNIAKCGTVHHIDKVDLGTKPEFFAGVCFPRLYEWLENKIEEFKDVDLVLIEQQMKVNPIAICLSHHIHAWVLIRTSAKAILYPSRNKTRVLGMALKVANKKGQVIKATKYQRKRWSIKVVEDFLKAREDEENLELIFKKNKSKKDDLCDTIIQGLSYVVSCMVKEKAKKKKKGLLE